MKSKCALIALILQANSLLATDSIWSGMTSNDWNTAGNWGPPATVPNVLGDEADFNKPGVVNRTVTITGVAITVGTITYDSVDPYSLNLGVGGTLTLQNLSGNSAYIQVTNNLGSAAHTIFANIGLSSPLIVETGSTSDFTISGIIAGAAQSLTKAGTGVLVLSAANSYGGGTFIDAGILSITADNNLGSPLTTAVTISNGTLRFTNPAVPPISIGTARPISLTGNSIIDVTSAAPLMPNTAILMGVVSGTGSLTKTNSGILQLTAANTYQGGTIVSAGTLSIANDGNLGNVAGNLTIATATLRTTASVNTARSGSFTGAATIDTQGNDPIFSGTFGGAGSLTVEGGGSVTLLGTGVSGANTYSGGTTIAIGTKLSGTTNGLQGSINASTATSVLDFSQNFNGTYGGVLAGVLGSQLVKSGSGAVTITGASPIFLGSTDIVGGTLIVNGSIPSSPLNVSLGTFLSGSGTVGPTTSNGTIQPGNGSSVGTLNINGTLMLGAGSHVIIDIAPVSSNNIAVSSGATISGPLTVNPTPGFYGFSADYTILTSTGLIGTFGPILSTNPAFAPTVTYSALNAFLHLVISEPFAVFPFSNSNTEAVGNNFDALYAADQLSPDLYNIINTFIGQSFATINDALDQMHPAQYSAFTELQAEMDGQLLSLFHRLPYLPCACSNPSRMWIEPFGNSLTLKRHGLEIGAQANSGGLAFGYDGQILENFVLGFGGAWNSSRLDWHDHRGHGDVNGLYGAIYFDSQIGNFYLGGSCLAGLDFYDAHRHIDFLTTDRHTSAEYQATDIMGQIATAYLFGSPQAFFYPYANLDYLYLHTHKINESKADGLDLKVEAHTDATLRTEMGLGLQVQDTNAAQTMCISPLVSIGWVNMTPLERPMLKSTFAGATIPFSVRGWDETWNLFNANFGLNITYRCYSLDLQYNAEMSADKKTLLFNQRGGIRFDWKW